MSFDNRHYVPCLRWKQGEYQAVLQLSDATKEHITPLIEIAEIGFDFETGTSSKSVDKHVAPFAKRVRTKWQRSPCFIDLKLIAPSERMADGRHPVRFIFDELRANGCLAIPVTGLNRDAQHQNAIWQAVSKDRRGVCVRISIEEAANPNVKALVENVLGEKGDLSETDIVLDLGAPNFTPVEGFLKVVEAVIGQLPYLSKWRSFTLIGTSFPPTMAEIKMSPAVIPRSEWMLYKKLVVNLTKAKSRIPTFGDYGISHPDVFSLDMRLAKPSATIRYTTDDAWFIVKGKNVRDYGFGQYRGHCQTVMQSPYFSGPAFSAADKYIEDCANGPASTGNLSTWRRVGTNHHIERVVSDIANFFAS